MNKLTPDSSLGFVMFIAVYYVNFLKNTIFDVLT